MDGSSSPVPSGPEGRSPLSASRRYNTDDASDPTTRVRVYKRRESVREVWIQVSLFTFWHILRNLLKMMNSGRIALAFLVAVIATIIFILTPSSVFHCERVKFGSVNPDLCDGGFDMESKCGRPLGLRQLSAGSVLAIDTYLGIFSVNLEGQRTVVLKKQAEVNGKPMKFLNDIDIVNQDVLIFTDSSTKWDRRHLMNILLEGIPNGRVLRLTRSTGKIDVIMDKLYFPNGIQLFPDKQSFLVSETGLARIKRYWIAGPRLGETEIFIDNLPGLPDNIRPGSNGTFWIGLATVRHSDRFSLLDYLADKPFIRKCILQLVPERQWEWLQSMFAAKHALILQLSEEGQIIASAHDPTGQVIKEVSQVTEANGHLYLGSYRAPFIARLRKDLIVY